MYLTASLDQPLHHAGEGLNKAWAWAWVWARARARGGG